MHRRSGSGPQSEGETETTALTQLLRIELIELQRVTRCAVEAVEAPDDLSAGIAQRILTVAVGSGYRAIVLVEALERKARREPPKRASEWIVEGPWTRVRELEK